ncbi:kinase-like domain, phloem protein 2-like protein [Tanacetum coccineum]
MASFLTDFKYLEIKLEEIKSATNNFDEKSVIGHGGFGMVYEGKLAFPHSEGEILVALKRLNRIYGQGDPEFYKEIRLLSCYRHENLISLLGFCNQGGEMILVYEHASGGSLDRLLDSPALTWLQRLKISLDAAKGISFLHDPNEAHQTVLHCDIKSVNILLDKNMNAKVSDFGLSKMGSTNHQYSALITSCWYPWVLLCAEFSNGQLNIFVPMWKKSYIENKLDDIIFKDLKQQMDQKSLETFTDIAFQCLQKRREHRPTMSLVEQTLKIALKFQDPLSLDPSDSAEIITAEDTTLTKSLLF